jgi:hypothetical protein
MNAPQIIIVCLWILGLVVHILKHGEEKVDKYNFYEQFFYVAITFSLLSWGGFFG